MIMNSSTILISFSTTGKDATASTPSPMSNTTEHAAMPGPGPPYSAELIILFVMLILFFIFGIVGNAMAFYIYYQKRDKTTSTLFILSLAATDFITCLITIPYTIATEMLKYWLVYDFACKSYLFFMTFNVPLSAFIMVAVGFDRYFCICHPFLHAMTVKRAKICLVVLTLLACGCGIMTAVGFGVYIKVDKVEEIIVNASAIIQPEPSPLPASPGVASSSMMMAGGVGTTMATTILGNSHSDGIYSVLNSSASASSFSSASGILHSVSGAAHDSSTPRVPVPSTLGSLGNETEEEEGVSKIHHLETVYYGMCVQNTVILPRRIMDVYQKIYAALFLVCFLVIALLYALIYHSILKRRAWKAKRKRMSCYASTANGPETTAVVAEETQLTNINGNNAIVKDGEGGTQTKSAPARTTSVALRDRMLYANIKTAAMLFVVTIVFIVSFLPSWLIGLEVMPMNYILFYIFFLNNVANPFIYAFMNRTFRDDLRQLCRRIKNRLSEW